MSDIVLYYQLLLYGGVIGILLGLILYVIVCVTEYKEDSGYVKELRKQLNQNKDDEAR